MFWLHFSVTVVKATKSIKLFDAIKTKKVYYVTEIVVHIFMSNEILSSMTLTVYYANICDLNSLL